MELLFHRIGLILVIIGCLYLQKTKADDKLNKVVIKVPSRVKHIYHHHTEKVHIHKRPVKSKSTQPKPKPVVKVVKIQEEVKWKPDWKNEHWKPKIHKGHSRKDSQNWKVTGGFDQKLKPKGFVIAKWNDEKRGSYEEFGTEESKIHEDYFGGRGGWNQDNDFAGDWEHSAREHSEEFIGARGKKNSGLRRGRGNKERDHKKKCDYDEQSQEASIIQEDWGRFNPSKNRLNSKKRGLSQRDHRHRSRQPYFMDTKFAGLEDFEDSFSKDGIWPERREHPSWHNQKNVRIKDWTIPVAEHSQDTDQETKESSSKFGSHLTYDDFINSSEFVPSSDFFRNPWNDKSDYIPQSSNFETNHEPIRKSALSVPLSAYFNGETTGKNLTHVLPSNYNNDHLNLGVPQIAASSYNNEPHKSLQNSVQPFYRIEPFNNNNRANKLQYNSDALSVSNTAHPFYNNLHTNNQQNGLYSIENVNNNHGNSHFTNDQLSNSGTKVSPSYYNNNNEIPHGILPAGPRLYGTTPGITNESQKSTTSAYDHYNIGVQSSQYQDTTPLSTSAYNKQTSNKNEGFSVVYQSHVGHKTNGTGLSSSYQEVKFGNVKRINSQRT